jgi:hypothetical protein
MIYIKGGLYAIVGICGNNRDLPMLTRLEKYYAIKNEISETYLKSYTKNQNSIELANDIKLLSIDDIIDILSVVITEASLKEMSRLRSVKNNIFDKLVVMISDSQNPWTLRLHTYPGIDRCHDSFTTY